MNSLSVPKDDAFNMDRQSEKKLNALMDAYGNDVLRTAYMFLKDRHKAEDAFQEVFIKVFKNLDGFRAESSEKTWIMRIAINTCKDMLRSSWIRRVILTAKASERTVKYDMAGNIARKADKRRLYDEVLALPRVFREVIILYYYQEFDSAEISRILNVAEGTVRSRLHRARETLKNRLGGRFDMKDE